MPIPNQPQLIDITFKERASREEVLGILNHVEPLEIRQSIINGVHRVMMETRPNQQLSDEAKEVLKTLKKNGHRVRFPSAPKR
jgi:hypothetical protein